MRYLCLVRDVIQHSGTERLAAIEELGRGSHLVAAGTLDAGAVVRVQAGLVSVAAGVPEPQHPIVAFFLIEARDLNDAIQLAARDPAARSGVIEVRPLRPTS